MCYGSCRWEGYMGECAYPDNIPYVKKYYPIKLCENDILGCNCKYIIAQYEKDCNNVRALVNEYYEDQKIIEKNKIRKSKILKILKNGY